VYILSLKTRTKRDFYDNPSSLDRNGLEEVVYRSEVVAVMYTQFLNMSFIVIFFLFFIFLLFYIFFHIFLSSSFVQLSPNNIFILSFITIQFALLWYFFSSRKSNKVRVFILPTLILIFQKFNSWFNKIFISLFFSSVFFTIY